jgi:O-methyltransferase
MLLLASLPITLRRYFQRSTGADYGIGLEAKLLLMGKMVRNNIRVPSASNFVEHLTMATTALNVPRSVAGNLVECGAYKGGSTVNLSLVAAACGRTLDVCDSFEGLPEPAADDRAHTVLHRGELHTYEKGAWSGSLDEVRRALEGYGSIDACRFHRGYFEDTLPGFDSPAVMVFADVDLRHSVETCLRHLWPQLVDGGCFYTHEAPHMEIAALFYDRDWWQANLKTDPPGLIGAGTGLGLIPDEGGYRSSIGFAVKAPADLHEVPQPGL